MEAVGEGLLYADTDSMILIYSPGDVALPSRSFLVILTNKLKQWPFIREFASLSTMH